MADDVKSKKLNLLASFENGETKSFPVGGKTLKVGKGASCDVVLKGREVAELEASITDVRGMSVIKSESGNGVRISGELVTEKILEDGDAIAFPGVELAVSREGFVKTQQTAMRPPDVISHLQASAKARQRVMGVAVIVVLAAIAGVLFVAKDFLTNKFFKPKAVVTTPAAKPISTRNLIKEITDARERFELAEDLYESKDLNDGNLYWAIKEWQAIVDELETVSPDADVYIEAKEKLQMANKELEARIEDLKHNAFIARQIGQTDDYQDLLRKIMMTKPDVTDKNYNMAKKLLMDAA